MLILGYYVCNGISISKEKHLITTSMHLYLGGHWTGRWHSTSLFRNKEFLVNLKTERNASKFAMFMEKENTRIFFRFSFRATFIFPFMNALVYVDMDQGIHKGKNESCSK